MTAGVEVAAAGREVVDLDRLDHVRADPGALGQLVDAQPEAACGRPRAAGPITGSSAGSTAYVVDDERLDRRPGPGDRADPVAPDHGVLDQVDAAGAAQLARLGQLAPARALVVVRGQGGRAR